MRPDKDALLRRLATGEVAHDDPEVRDAAAADAGFARAAADVRAVTSALAAAGHEQRQVLRAAADPQLADVPEVDVAAVVRGLRHVTPAPRRRGGQLLLLLAAMAVVALGVAWWLARDAATPQRVRLGGSIAVQAPESLSDGGLRLSWRAPEPAPLYHRARLLAVDDARELARADRLPSPQWTLDRQARTTLPERVVLEVTALDASRQVVATGRAELSLPR